MTRRRARNLAFAIGGILLLIGIGAMRGTGAGDDAMTLFDSADRDGESAAGSGGDDARQRSASPTSGTAALADSETEEAGFSGDFVDAQAGSGVSIGGGGGSAGSGASGGGSAVADQGSSVGLLPLPALQASDRIIKDGHIAVEVPDGQFERAFNAVLRLASRVNGQVVGSQSSREGDRASGEVTIRVPAQRFEELLSSTEGIGTVEHREVVSQDVSGEFVDLEARVRHLQAQERFYLGLLEDARVVGDAIAINQHLSGVQAEIEQVQGRLRLLDERTTYSRLTVSLHEPGVSPLLTSSVLEDRGPLARAWADAVLALQQTMGALLVGAFTAAPLAVLALLGWALWRRLRPSPAVRQDPRPAREDEQGPVPVG